MTEAAPPFGDSLPFEVVSFDQAREALEALPAGVHDVPVAPPDWRARRRTLSEAERRVSRAATQWMLELPTELRPLELLRQYPRIANRLCTCWSDAELALQVFDELVMDLRGNRQGFPRPVAMELQALSIHLQRAARQSKR